MSTTAIGRAAEQAAAEFLQRQGYDILEHNWRTRWCEIDLVACKDKCMHFVEVKYRSREGQGSGLDYVTPAKLKQMRFAASQWVNGHSWSGEVNIAAVEVTGPDFAIGTFIETVY